ncbi:MAG: hypothetical protein D6E12_02315 [Desulfovibrio sp.]|nr:MAG: hypothetical protein D6E12_02315 [Desulfovibrio sp.]
MNRRQMLRNIGIAVAASAFVSPAQALALLRCQPTNYGYNQCEAGIDTGVLNQTVSATGWQEYDQWCWAACIEMVFRYYGFEVDQQRIVRETWGSIVNMPGYPEQIMANLNRTWVDDRGRHFRSQGDQYSANALSAAEDLANNRPLIVGTMGHAMLLTAMMYTTNDYGHSQLVSAVVRDPAPGQGRRLMTPQELHNVFFMARIWVNAA